MVGQAGLEPAMHKASDLQSDGVTNFPTLPYMLLLLRGATALALNAVTSTANRLPCHAPVKYVLQRAIYGFFINCYC